MNRKLTPEELRLWKAQLKGVKLLPTTAQPPEKTEQDKIVNKPPVPPNSSLKKKRKEPPSSPPFQSFGRKEVRRMKIDARLDLHGLSLKEGYDTLERFLIHAQERGVKTILVITGKGSLSSENTLRHHLPRWIKETPLQSFVSFLHHPAKPQDGGAGAFYIGVRKK